MRDGSKANTLDLRLYLIEFLYHQILPGEKRIVRDLENREWRRLERCHFNCCLEINPRRVQSPQPSEIYVKREISQAKLVEITIFADFSTLETFEDRMFRII